MDNSKQTTPATDTSNPDAADAINRVTALKAMPHIYQRLVQLWGCVEFFEYLDSLLLVDPERGNRQGFPLEVYRELNMLDETFCRYPNDVASRATFMEKNAIMSAIKERDIRGIFAH